MNAVRRIGSSVMAFGPILSLGTHSRSTRLPSAGRVQGPDTDSGSVIALTNLAYEDHH
jgi:hypothetical protein